MAQKKLSYNFIWNRDYEPHQKRRIEILKKYPDVKKIMGPDFRSKWICLVLVCVQLYISTVIQSASWITYLGISYIIGATLSQALFLAVHETSHNLVFVSGAANRWFSIFLNLPIVIPFSVAFRHYHIDHHKYQGVDGLDTDLPTNLELRFVRGKYLKCIWMIFQIVIYTIRPLIYGKNRVSITPILVCNIIIQSIFDLFILRIWGYGPLVYMLICVFIAGGLHPCAGHFLSEHYLLQGPSDLIQETSSYYGYLNWFTWNVGYHNEHHDFPYISGLNLPDVRNIAPEYYDSLQTYDSWIYIIYRFIFTDSIGPHCRVKRV